MCCTHHAIREEAANAPGSHIHHHIKTLIVRRGGPPPLPGIFHPGIPLLETPLLPETLSVRVFPKLHGEQTVIVCVYVRILYLKEQKWRQGEQRELGVLLFFSQIDNQLEQGRECRFVPDALCSSRNSPHDRHIAKATQFPEMSSTFPFLRSSQLRYHLFPAINASFSAPRKRTFSAEANMNAMALGCDIKLWHVTLAASPFNHCPFLNFGGFVLKSV